MLRLLLREEAGKRDDISVDLLVGYRSRFAITLRHFWCSMSKTNFCSQCRYGLEGERCVLGMQGEVVFKSSISNDSRSPLI